MKSKSSRNPFQSQPILNFFSSVKLAVPLLLTLAIVSCVGTLIESRYNTAYAKFLIYDTWWMSGLLALLWINILFAALSRYPFKKHHVGFVVTHIGLLLLLIGSIQTKLFGIDGQLRVVEGSQNNRVFLSELTLEVNSDQMTVRQDLTRPRSPQQALDLVNLSKQFAPLTIMQFLPFATKEREFVSTSDPASSAVAISFWMRSPMFQVSEELHSQMQPELKMGPATIRLVTGEFDPSKYKKNGKPAGKPKVQVRKISNSGDGYIEFSDPTNPGTSKRVQVKAIDDQPFTVGKQKIRIKRLYMRAAVVENKIAERPEGPFNVAVELEFMGPDGQWLRDVRYEKFPDFSVLNTFQPETKIAFNINLPESEQAPAAIPGHATPSPASMGAGGNVIEFYVNPQQTPPKAHLVLSKNGELVLDQEIIEGDTVATPWMGMKISLGTLKVGVTTKWQLLPAVAKPGFDLPPSGIHLRSPMGEDIVLLEGEVERFRLSESEVGEVYFGRNYLTLPFVIGLEKFKKIDYPGSETPMSFASDVSVLPSQEKVTISMNEPLKHEGYTLYQASYEMGQQGPPASIFSVNKDPGRFLKYFGSLVLSIGIILFTLMRSSFYKRKFT